MRKPIEKKRWRHDRAKEWIHVRYFCPNCGKRDMWQRDDDSEGDYYHQNTAYCHSCGADMCCVGPPEEFNEPQISEVGAVRVEAMLEATVQDFLAKWDSFGDGSGEIDGRKISFKICDLSLFRDSIEALREALRQPETPPQEPKL